MCRIAARVDEVRWLPGWQRASLDETTRALDAWAAAKRQIASRLAWRAWAGQEAAPPNLLLFRTLKRVHLRSPSAIAQWLAQVTANTDRVVRDAR